MSPKKKNLKRIAKTLNEPKKPKKKTVICPLCTEELEIDDLQFFPCSCAYQVCRFCWHRIRTEENGLCPGCRKSYPENPANFTALTQKDMINYQSKKRKDKIKKKPKMCVINRLDLEGLRILQPNLMFVVGLPPRLIKPEILKKPDYFGKYGPIERIVINPHTRFLGIQGPTVAVYITYVHNDDALKAIQCINLFQIDGRIIKANLGMTKYCKHFIKNNRCVKSDCTYLHQIAAPELTFTIEEMNQRKHYEYEKRLHDILETTTKLNELKIAKSKKLSVKTSDKANQTDIGGFCCSTPTCDLSKLSYQRNDVGDSEKYDSWYNSEVDAVDTKYNQKDIKKPIGYEKLKISKYEKNYVNPYVSKYLNDFEKPCVDKRQKCWDTETLTASK